MSPTENFKPDKVLLRWIYHQTGREFELNVEN